MPKLLVILRAIVAYRTLLFPAIVGFVSAFAAAIGWKVDIGKVQAVVNATGALATVLSLIVGAVMDANNRAVKAALTENKEAIENTAAQTSDKLTRVSDQVNAIIDPNQTPQYVPSPVEVKPTEKAQ